MNVTTTAACAGPCDSPTTFSGAATRRRPMSGCVRQIARRLLPRRLPRPPSSGPRSAAAGPRMRGRAEPAPPRREGSGGPGRDQQRGVGWGPSGVGVGTRSSWARGVRRQPGPAPRAFSPPSPQQRSAAPPSAGPGVVPIASLFCRWTRLGHNCRD
jgi:hypothetical protein